MLLGLSAYMAHSLVILFANNNGDPRCDLQILMATLARFGQEGGLC